MTRDEQQAVALAHARRYATEPDRGSLKRIGKEHVANVLAALDAERAKVAERTRERDASEADRATWRHRAEVADHARATLNEHLAATEKRLAEVTRERDEARAAIQEAEERGARWALVDWNDMSPRHARELAARICDEARAKGGER